MTDDEWKIYAKYLATQQENIAGFVNDLYVQLSSPITKPAALPNILRHYAAELYLLITKASRHEDLELEERK